MDPTSSPVSANLPRNRGKAVASTTVSALDTITLDLGNMLSVKATTLTATAIAVLSLGKSREDCDAVEAVLLWRP
eukprot:CAMPEP_0185751740 /NCGR_PEP_ID=MMETSP1174-20130828/10530_1 /TAXON_ID=35687 /ORGANISM="Dictyocha speculum, Strain CCMP1381" /LENGTH=74 /DNA_ID=CAMNT_0028428871 /DNA_START=511 /DNA_END=731 /DNA_ORIENTATION=-